MEESFDSEGSADDAIYDGKDVNVGEISKYSDDKRSVGLVSGSSEDIEGIT